MNTNKKINGVKLSKQYMLQAALFRRTAMSHMNWNKSYPRFSADMLIELYRYESTGEANRHYDAMKRDNGYAMGKWLRDIDVANIKQGVKCGDFAKIEFLGTLLEQLHNSKFISEIIVNRKPDIPINNDIMSDIRKQENKRKLRIWRFTYLMYRWYIRYSLSRGKYLYKPNFYLHTFSKG